MVGTVGATVLRIILTGLASFILLLEANGYAVNFQTLAVTKVGLLVVSAQPATATVTVDNVTIKQQQTQWITKLPAGTYTVSASTPGYQTWRNPVQIESGMSRAYPSVWLFLATPIVTDVRPATARELFAPLVDETLKVDGTEIWHTMRGQSKLITRYFEPVQSAVMVGSEHVAVQIGSTIHILDMDGTNDQVLMTLPDKRQRRLLVPDDRTLGLLDGTQVTIYRIR